MAHRSRRNSSSSTAFELLRSVLGAELIAVYDRYGRELLWKKSDGTTCQYQSEGIDSESHQDSNATKEISTDG